MWDYFNIADFWRAQRSQIGVPSFIFTVASPTRSWRLSISNLLHFYYLKIHHTYTDLAMHYCFLFFLLKFLYTLKTKTRKKNKFRSNTAMVFFSWNQKCFLFEKKCSFFRNKSWFVLKKVTFLTLFLCWTWIRTKKRIIFLRMYEYEKFCKIFT
jgi:hypothetical protein